MFAKKMILRDVDGAHDVNGRNASQTNIQQSQQSSATRSEEVRKVDNTQAAALDGAMLDKEFLGDDADDI